MNERIWELAKQAYSDDMPYDSNIPTEFIVRLSELIVRECITVARKANGLDAEYEAWYLIEQHFGVEE